RHLTDTLATGESRSESSAVVEGLDGRPVHVSVVTAPLAGRSGAVTSAVAVVRDISRLRQLEAEVRRGETLAAAGQMAIGLAHEDRIMQVFHNLVRNAIEAMPGGGRLTLVTRLSMNPLFAKVDLGQGQRSMAEIQIADEGAGISEETRPKLFTPFFTTKERGLGLGLALCHRIVDEHGGAIQVTSEPGRGT